MRVSSGVKTKFTEGDRNGR